MKRARCRRVGIESRSIELPGHTTTAELVVQIGDLSADPSVDGILLQHPVPGQIDERAAFEAIVPSKDVDGVTMHSFAAMALGMPSFQSCTPGGIVRPLDAYDVTLAGRRPVVIGRSPQARGSAPARPERDGHLLPFSNSRPRRRRTDGRHRDRRRGQT
jgi:methylenetetrahydrofolate dehydrogenase (NADP+)/methenyltetrahydrofolate cyclohydrolase